MTVNILYCTGLRSGLLGAVKDLGPKTKAKDRCHKAKDLRCQDQFQGQKLGSKAKTKDSRSHLAQTSLSRSDIK